VVRQGSLPGEAGNAVGRLCLFSAAFHCYAIVVGSGVWQKRVQWWESGV